VTKEAPTAEGAAPDDRQQQEANAGTYSVTGTLNQQFWVCPGASGFKVRGPTYLQVRSPLLEL
jgi:hypothetical protein